VAILDCCAERLSLENSLLRVEELNPRVVCFTVYGQNPNSGTTNMIGARTLSKFLKKSRPDIKTVYVGSHVSALPREVLDNDDVDIVLLNEGVYALHNLLNSNLDSDLEKVKGIGFKNGNKLCLNSPERLVPQDLMDVDMPGYA
jgi:anaerobic magnesium-protoporphyrin IX monomethyl ester cyclase